MFSNKDLKNLIVPLFLEQLLMALVGIADVFVIGFVGEAAVSGVSLVNSFNTIFLNLFTVLASGGAVVISQYIGHKDKEHAGQAASQLLTASVILSVVISVVILLTNASLIGIWLNLGVIGIAFAMCLDWSVRGIIFWWRFKQGKWKIFKVI
nr:MATE family efflux transporter [uncultured Blautia sp.]